MCLPFYERIDWNCFFGPFTTTKGEWYRKYIVGSQRLKLSCNITVDLVVKCKRCRPPPRSFNCLTCILSWYFILYSRTLNNLPCSDYYVMIMLILKLYVFPRSYGRRSKRGRRRGYSNYFQSSQDTSTSERRCNEWNFKRRCSKRAIWTFFPCLATLGFWLLIILIMRIVKFRLWRNE